MTKREMPPTRGRVDVAERLRHFRKTYKGGMTQAEISRVLEIDQQRFSAYELGTELPGSVLAGLIKLGLRPEWLFFEEGPMMEQEVGTEEMRGLEVRLARDEPGLDDEREMSEFCVLPLYVDEAAAGEPREMRDTAVEGPAILHRAWCPNPETTDYVRVASTGTSMEPTIPAGSIVTIDRSRNRPEELVGKVVAIALRDDGVTLKRLRRTERGGWVGVPDNADGENRLIHLEEGDRVIGLVTTVHARLA